MMVYLQVSIAIFFSLLVHQSVRLLLNYRKACQIGLPLVIVPVNWQDPIWILIERRLEWLNDLPFGLGAWYHFAHFGWNLHDRYAAHKRLGGAFTIVTPNRNEIVLCDPANIYEATAKYKKWLRPKEVYSFVETFGPNVDTVNGEDWPKHRKVINQAFVESNMNAVWDGAIRQAEQWLQRLSGSKYLAQLALDCDIISGNVLMHAVFNQHRDFEEGLHKVYPGHKNEFGEKMLYVIRNTILAWVLGRAELPSWIEPKFMTTMRRAKKELRLHFEETLERRDGFLTNALLEANESEKVNGSGHLTREEIYGNLFVINLAGLDTTYYAMLFSIALLALHPEVQEWARQDINAYRETFDKAIRIRAVMYETLRHFGVGPPLVRYSPKTQTMSINGQEHIIPPMTFVTSNLSAPNNNPDVWGEDASVWRPQRWIERVDGVERLRKEEMYTWSVGPRICPGKRFSQVEFTAVIGKLLHQFKLESSPELHATVNDFEFNITPKVKRPRRAHIDFVRRHTPGSSA